MPSFPKNAANAINSLLARANLILVRRDTHQQMAREPLMRERLRRERQALSREQRPYLESLATLGADAGVLLAGRAAANLGGLGQHALVVGNGPEATLVADALESTGRSVSRTNVRGIEAALERSTADVVLVEPARGAEQYELVHRLRFEHRRKVFTPDELLGGAAMMEAIDELVGVYIQPMETAIRHMAGSPIWESIACFDAREPLRDKRVIEFGPLDGCMTGSIVAAGAASVTCIELRLANVLKVLVAGQALGWRNVSVLIDDMHNVDSMAYGTFDVVVAHGVYYHSATPFRFLENLTTLGDTIFLGGYCVDPDQRRGSLVTLDYNGMTVRAQPFREKLANDGAGVHEGGYYFVPSDLQALFERWGFAVEVVDLEATPPERQASHYLRLIARRR